MCLKCGERTFFELPNGRKCHAIIHFASTAAGSAGTDLAQVPGSGNDIITPIQLTMTIVLPSSVHEGILVVVMFGEKIIGISG